MVYHADRAAHLREDLVATLVQAGVLAEGPWAEAFRQVPRHVFVPRLFVPAPRGGWVAVGADHPDFLSLVYRDDVCVTQLNGSEAAWEQAAADGVVHGVPTSSSSMPTIMAVMLAALDARPGDTVLEIGTGTGYNAALLAHVLGDGAVTSVDVDPDVHARAVRALAEVGRHPRCVVGDGERGVPEHAPYRRVLGTCAVSRLPPAWPAQAEPGGVVVTTLNRPLGAGLLRLVVRDGAATGRVLREDGRFMPLRAHRQAWADEALHRARRAPAAITRPTPLPARTALDPLSGFEFFAGLALPGVAVGLDPVRLVHPDGSWVRHRGAVVDEGGPRRLWALAEDAHRRWRSLGRPRRHRFAFTATAARQWFALDGSELTWDL
ncbi:methyltransferase domain-containing protein [Saccharothrix obliqua]|uniref:methyltransferase domain-containing protein n=1 Tax=Saccharothrix obliqua TaxID=2861747 RepID=UPI0027E22EA5|nr:methyltransferase domain-containing protein [Saccharothrix obliqua]